MRPSAEPESPPVSSTAGAPDRPPEGLAGAAPGWLPALIIVFGWLVLFPLTRHYGNPDGPSYVAVAELWLAGQLPEAVNAYWGPLLSWLAAPLIAVGVEGIDALRIVLLGGALATLPPLRALCRQAGASAAAATALGCAVAPFLVYNALFGLYPDVLYAAALLGSLALLLHPSATRSTRAAAGAGALAAVAFLAKAYALPVTLLALPLGAALHLLPPVRAPVRAVGRLLGVGLATSALLTGAWVATLSAAYGELTISTSAGFNLGLVSSTSAGNPYNVRGLHAPPRPDAVSAWEEPSRLPIPQRSDAAGAPAPSPGDEAAHRLTTAFANARIVVGSLLRRGLPLVGLALVAAAAAIRRRRLPPPALTGAILAAGVHVAGLLASIAIERYTWAPLLLLAPAAALGLDVLAAGRRARQVVLTGLVVVVMAASAVHGIAPRIGAHADVTRAADALGSAGVLDGEDVATADSWQETHLLCHRVTCRYVGRPMARDAAAVAAELTAAGVTRFVVWADDAEEVEDLPPPEAGVLLTVFAVEADGLTPVTAVRR